MVDSILVSIDTSSGADKTVVVVGRKKAGMACKVINMFCDQEALDIIN